MSSQQQCVAKQALAEIVTRSSLAVHTSLGDILNAAAEADNVLEFQRSVRTNRKSAKQVLGWLGLAVTNNGDSIDFPPQNLQGRLRTLDEGRLPSDARAHEWGGLDA